jgi:NAD(P)-dependent dehydrogenase (short-subunit alcohol dehydrogenase family)
MMANLENRVVLVTGAGSGIGRASALALAQVEARVVVSDIHVESGDETVQMIADAGGEAFFIKADVAIANEVEAMIKAAVETFGRLDAAVNNAGVTSGGLARLADIDEDTFDRVININLKGVWLCLKHEIPVMLHQGSGAIVNIASVAGLGVQPKDAPYTASKHGVVGLTKVAAIEYAKFNIRVNAVCPAYTDTPMVQGMDEKMAERVVRGIPMKRLGQPEEIAAGVVWLCSDESSFVTGHALALDGGVMAI